MLQNKRYFRRTIHTTTTTAYPSWSLKPFANSKAPNAQSNRSHSQLSVDWIFCYFMRRASGRCGISNTDWILWLLVPMIHSQIMKRRTAHNVQVKAWLVLFAALRREENLFFTFEDVYISHGLPRKQQMQFASGVLFAIPADLILKTVGGHACSCV